MNVTNYKEPIEGLKILLSCYENKYYTIDQVVLKIPSELPKQTISEFVSVYLKPRLEKLDKAIQYEWLIKLCANGKFDIADVEKNFFGTALPNPDVFTFLNLLALKLEQSDQASLPKAFKIYSYAAKKGSTFGQFNKARVLLDKVLSDGVLLDVNKIDKNAEAIKLLEIVKKDKARVLLDVNKIDKNAEAIKLLEIVKKDKVKEKVESNDFKTRVYFSDDLFINQVIYSYNNCSFLPRREIPDTSQLSLKQADMQGLEEMINKFDVNRLTGWLINNNLYLKAGDIKNWFNQKFVAPNELALFKEFINNAFVLAQSKQFYFVQMRSAISLYNFILILAPDFLDARLALAEALLWCKSYKESMDELRIIQRSKSDIHKLLANYLEVWLSFESTKLSAANLLLNEIDKRAEPFHFYYNNISKESSEKDEFLKVQGKLFKLQAIANFKAGGFEKALELIKQAGSCFSLHDYQYDEKISCKKWEMTIVEYLIETKPEFMNDIDELTTYLPDYIRLNAKGNVNRLLGINQSLQNEISPLIFYQQALKSMERCYEDQETRNDLYLKCGFNNNYTYGNSIISPMDWVDILHKEGRYHEAFQYLHEKVDAGFYAPEIAYRLALAHCLSKEFHKSLCAILKLLKLLPVEFYGKHLTEFTSILMEVICNLETEVIATEISTLLTHEAIGFLPLVVGSLKLQNRSLASEFFKNIYENAIELYNYHLNDTIEQKNISGANFPLTSFWSANKLDNNNNNNNYNAKDGSKSETDSETEHETSKNR